MNTTPVLCALILFPSLLPAAVLLSSSRLTSATGAGAVCRTEPDPQSSSFNSPGTSDSSSSNTAGAFIHTASGSGIYGSSEGSQNSLLGTNGFTINSMSVSLYNGFGCFANSISGPVTAQSSLSYSFRLLEPYTFTYTGTVTSVGNDASVTVQFRSDTGGYNVTTNLAVPSGPMNGAGYLPAGDYTLNVSMLLSAGFAASSPSGSVMSSYQLNNMVFALQSVPEPGAPTLAAAAAALLLRRRRAQK